MVCPKCRKRLREQQLIKANIKGVNNVEIVYDAVCPFCYFELGQMHWGKLISKYDSLWQDEQPRDYSVKKEPISYYCPHCGETMSELEGGFPIDRRKTERRTAARRVVEDRRENEMNWLWKEHRRLDRRARQERRQQVGRRKTDAPVPEAVSAEILNAETANAANEARREDRRKIQRPVLYDRRKPANERRRRDRSDDMDFTV